MVFDGSSSIFCRMFTNLDEVIKGFSRFIYAAFGSFLMESIAIFFISLLFLVPFILLPTGIFIFNWTGVIITLNIIQIFIILGIKIVLSLKFKSRILDILLTPISVTYIALIAANSYIQSKFGMGVSWKGRTYGISGGDNLGLAEDKSKKNNI